MFMDCKIGVTPESSVVKNALYWKYWLFGVTVVLSLLFGVWKNVFEVAFGPTNDSPEHAGSLQLLTWNERFAIPLSYNPLISVAERERLNMRTSSIVPLKKKLVPSSEPTYRLKLFNKLPVVVSVI